MAYKKTVHPNGGTTLVRISEDTPKATLGAPKAAPKRVQKKKTQDPTTPSNQKD